MGITKRQGEILNRIVQDYIDLATPVSSEFLEEKHHFGICPATIRIEMQKLTDADFLFQPHTSAGRVPTDKGYRFFVNNLLGKGIGKEKDIFELEDLIEKEMGDTIKFLQSLERSEGRRRMNVLRPLERSEGWRRMNVLRPLERSEGWRRMNVLRLLTKNLALFSSNLALGYLFDENIFWKEGWEEVLQEPEFKETNIIANFADVIKHFEEEIEGLKINSGIKVFIGKENPFSKAKEFSIIISGCHLPEPQRRVKKRIHPLRLPEKENAILAIAGPKRMAYDKNINSLNSLTKLLERL